MRRRPYRLAVAAVVAAAAVPFVASCAADAPAAAPAAAAAQAGIAQAPWAEQPRGSPSIRDVPVEASLAFPAGTSYAEALTRLLASAGRDSLPPGTTLMPPLPAEVVYVAPADPSEGIRLSLTAPWGWALETGAIRPPSYSLPGSLTPEEAASAARQAQASGDVLPPGAEVDVPDLPACQVAHGDPDARPPCT